MTGELSETIWCHTTDPSVPWEYCDPIHEENIIEESLKMSLESLTGENKDRAYRGSQHKTRKGLLCQEWSS